MLNREDWLPLARKLDWNFSYTTEREVFPEVISGRPWLPHSSWQDWEEAFKTSYREYVQNQHEKDMAVYAVRDAVGRLENVQSALAGMLVRPGSMRHESAWRRRHTRTGSHALYPVALATCCSRRLAWPCDSLRCL
jgi:hypothetical protein